MAVAAKEQLFTGSVEVRAAARVVSRTAPDFVPRTVADLRDSILLLSDRLERRQIIDPTPDFWTVQGSYEGFAFRVTHSGKGDTTVISYGREQATSSLFGRAITITGLRNPYPGSKPGYEPTLRVQTPAEIVVGDRQVNIMQTSYINGSALAEDQPAIIQDTLNFVKYVASLNNHAMWQETNRPLGRRLWDGLVSTLTKPPTE